MTCSELHDKIPLLAAGELSPGEAAGDEAHIQECVSCGEMAREMSGIDALCRETFQAFPAQPHSPPRWEQPAPAPRLRLGLGIAAAFLILGIGLAVYIAWPGPEESPDGGVTIRGTQEEERDEEPRREEPRVVIPEATATVSGTVYFDGAAPGNTAIDMGADPYCAGRHTTPQYTEEVLVRNGRLQNVLVYLREGVTKRYAAPADPVVLDQEGCRFRPHVAAAMRGQRIVFRNSDNTVHNVHLLATRNPEENFSQMSRGQEERVLRIPEIGAPIRCDVHPWMSAYIHVLRHPYFAVTGDDGTFELRDVPEGSYTLAFWHEKFGEQTFEIDASGDLVLDHRYREEKVAAGPAGTIHGTVLFKGEPPANLEIPLGSDAYCASRHVEPLTTERALVHDGKLQNVLVYIRKGIKGTHEPPDEAVVLDQEGCTYRPHIVALMKDQRLIIRNSDSTAHNVHFLPRRNPEDNFSQSTIGFESERIFRVPEIGGVIKCDVHPWMKAYFHVLKHPFFAVTGKDGAFYLGDVPPGGYTLEFWHETFGRKKLRVMVRPDTTETVGMTFRKE